MTKEIDPRRELALLHTIYSQMKLRVDSLRDILLELTLRLEHSEDEEPAAVLREIKAQHSPERIEALMGEMIDLYHHEQEESKKALATTNSMTWAEYQAWMKTEVEKVNEMIAPTLEFLKEYVYRYWVATYNGSTKKESIPFNNAEVKMKPFMDHTAIPVGYFWEYGPVGIKIYYLDKEVGKILRKKPLSKENFNDAKLKKPLVRIQIDTEWIHRKDLAQIITRLTAAFKIMDYKIQKIKKD